MKILEGVNDTLPSVKEGGMYTWCKDERRLVSSSIFGSKRFPWKLKFQDGLVADWCIVEEMSMFLDLIIWNRFGNWNLRGCLLSQVSSQKWIFGQIFVFGGSYIWWEILHIFLAKGGAFLLLEKALIEVVGSCNCSSLLSCISFPSI